MSENDFLGVVICARVGDAAFCSNSNQIYCIQELQEMVLEADIDGDGQVLLLNCLAKKIEKYC